MSRTIFVTGADSVAGWLLARALASRSHSVIAAMDLSPGNDAPPGRRKSRIPNIDIVYMNGLSEFSVDETFRAILVRYGRIDVLINQMGKVTQGMDGTESEDAVREIVNAGTYAAVLTSSAILPTMENNREGLIINVSCGLDARGIPFRLGTNLIGFGPEGPACAGWSGLRERGVDAVVVYCGMPDIGSIEGLGEPPAAGDYRRRLRLKREILNAVLALMEMKAGSRPPGYVVEALIRIGARRGNGF
ncbi:MAG TPA: SDR family NAD(P)-dependent oxidoreductase [Puia sp.]|jgi:NAD(P)-dependent dehydrogenase (short-subunit alcohol dehydrogenase family)